jgi:hypothetical protein
MSNEKFRPFGPNNVVNHRYDIDEDYDSIVPYKINGKYYPVKLLKKTEDGSLELLGYTDIIGKNVYDWTLYLNPDDPVLEKYNYKHGYFETNDRGDYRIEFQVDNRDNTIRILGDEFSFHPYSAFKTEAEKFVAFQESGKEYILKIQYTIPHAGSLDRPIYANVVNSNQYMIKIKAKPGSTNVYDAVQGHFQSDPSGVYEITYKLDVDGETQERKGRFKWVQAENAPLNSSQKALYNEIIRQYIKNSTNEDIKRRIINKIDRTWPTLEKEVLLFRGQQNPFAQEIKTQKHTFFSTSLDEHIASHKFTSLENKCCLFVIHAQPGLKYYSTVPDMYEVADKYKRGRQGEEIEESPEGSFEDEVLLEGNGQFFQDKEKTTPGFRELSFEEVDALGLTEIDKTSFGPKNHGSGIKQTTGIFEAYYFPPAVEGGRRKRKTRKARKQKRKSRKQKKSKLL